MKVLHINHFGFSRGGGSGNAMRLLHLGLKKAGIDSKVLCWNEPEPIPDVIRIKTSGYQRRIEDLLGRVTSRLSLNDINRVSSFYLKNQPAFLEADIVNFHILNGWFSYLALPFLTRAKAAVWSLHDMWSFTGHCYYSLDCERWKTGCGRCPHPETFPQIQRDNTRIEWKLKDWSYRRSNLTFVTPSIWLAGQARASMMGRFPIHHVPYGVDTESYKPLDPDRCRDILDIPRDKKVIMFAADSLRNPVKGMDLLRESLQLLPQAIKRECLLLLLGHGGESFPNTIEIPILNLGYVSSDRLKAVAYSSANLFVHPSRADNLPLVLQESMACGTPMVAFQSGGTGELVRPGITGYLAEAQNPQDLCNGIATLLTDDSLRSDMARRCREIALNEYPWDLYIRRYADLYGLLLRERQKTAQQHSEIASPQEL